MQYVETSPVCDSFRTLEAARNHRPDHHPIWIRSGSGNIVVSAGGVKFAQCNIASHNVIDRSQVIVIDLSNHLSGNAHHDASIGNRGFRWDDGSGGNDAAASDRTIIQHNRTGSDQSSRSDRFTVDHRSVADSYIVRDHKRYSVLRMENCTVLNIHSSTQGDGGDVAANDRMVHHRRMIPQCHIATHVRGRSDIDVSSKSRFDVAHIRDCIRQTPISEF